VFISIFNDRSFGAAMANREMHQNPHVPFKRWQINYPLSDSVTVRVFLTIARAIRLG